MTIDEVVEKYGAALREHASAVSALSAAENTLEVVLSELLAEAEGSEWKAKASARASSAYKAHLRNVMTAREDAEKAKAEVEYLRVRFEVWRSKTSMEKTMRQVR